MPDINKIIGKVSDFFKKLFEKDSSQKILSILCAVIIWAVVSISVYPTMERSIYNVPVTISLEDTYAQANQLDVISMTPKTVNVTISGKRGQIGDLKTEDLTAVLAASNVMMAREYNLSMNIECSTGKTFDVVSIEPSTISVTFDKIVSKEFEITPQLENVKIASGYMSGDPIVTPSTVTVTGPLDMVSSITKVCAKVAPEQELSSTYEFTTSDLVLYNNNAVISNDNQQLTFDKSSFAIQIPVYVRQILPLNVNIINAPENFDIDYFRSQLVFSVDELPLSAPKAKIKDLPELKIGTIHLREGDGCSVFECKAENFLPEDYENLTQIDTVTVTCPSEGISKKAIAIMGKDIQFVNKPAQFEFEPVASGMTLFVVGDSDQIAAISKEDLTAQIDLIDFDMQEGDHKMSVDFLISSYDKVWLNGDEGVATPKIYVTAKLISDE